MKTARTIEEQEARKEAEKEGIIPDVSEPVSEARRRSNENLRPHYFPKGVSGNPGGIPKDDVAARLARAIFEEDPDAIKAAFSKMLRKGSPYAFQVLADRAYGKLKETVAHEVTRYQGTSDEDLRERIKQLENELGLVPALPPADDTKPN